MDYNDTPVAKVFTKPNCPACEATKKLFAKLGAEIEVVNLEDDLDALNFVKEQGFVQAPVVGTKLTRKEWSGYKPDLIREAVRKHREAADTHFNQPNPSE